MNRFRRPPAARGRDFARLRRAGQLPSLAPRAAERGLAGGSAPAPCPDLEAASATPPQRAPGPPPSDPQLLARVAALVEAARAGEAEFAALLARADAAVGRAGAAGSDAWVAAQQEVSRLQAARARTSDALAELDSLSIGRSAGPEANAADVQAVLGAEDEVRSLAERQQAALDRLSEQLGAP